MDTYTIVRAKFDKNIFAFIRARQKWDYGEMKAVALSAPDQAPADCLFFCVIHIHILSVQLGFDD